MNWYVLVNGEIKADNLNKISAFKYCWEYSDKHPEVEPNKILMCRKIRRNGKEMYCKASFVAFHEDGVMFNAT